MFSKDRAIHYLRPQDKNCYLCQILDGNFWTLCSLK